MKNLSDLILREWKRLLKNRLSIWALFILPLLSTILFFGIYQNAYVLNIPSVVVDKDKTVSSRRLIRYLEQHRFLSIKFKLSDFKSAMPLIHAQKAYILIYIPEHFEKNILQFNQPTVKTYAYGTNLMIGRLAQKASLESFSALSKELSLANTEKLRQESIYSQKTGSQPTLDIHNVYNPNYNYLWYMSPALVMSIWQMILLISCIPLFSKEWENDKYRELKTISNSNSLKLYLGKLLLPYLFFIINYWVLYYIVFPIYNLQVLGAFLPGFILFSLFFVSVINMAFIISNIIKQSLFSTEIGVFLTAPAFAFSGYTFPFYEMPMFHRIFACIMPSTHLLPVYSMYYLQNTPLIYQLYRLIPLLIYFLISTLTAIILIRKNLIKQDQ